MSCDLNCLEDVRKALRAHSDVSLVYYCAAVHGPAGFNYEKVWRETLQVNAAALHCILACFEPRLVASSCTSVRERYLTASHLRL